MGRRAVKAAVIIGVVFAVLASAAAFLYFFGTPTSSRVAQAPAPAAVAGPATGAASVDGTQVTPPDPGSPLAVEIPGCVCHSDDPRVVKQHAGYRMNQCASCHAGGVPTGR